MPFRGARLEIILHLTLSTTGDHMRSWWQKYRNLAEFLALVIAWPIGATWLIYGERDIFGGFGAGFQLGSGYREHAVMLAISGLAGWVALRIRRGG